MMEAIRFEQVTVAYGQHKALDRFSLSVKEGEFLTIIGRSGCGKTTTLRLVNGLCIPDSGEVYVNGKNVKEWNLIELRRSIGYAIQEVGLFPHMTVAKNIGYVPSLSRQWSKAEEKRHVAELLATVGLEEKLAGRYPHELSGGQKQRAGIARALAVNPRILLMDEPFGAVDEITRRSLQEEILQLQRKLGITVLFVTHDIHEAMLLGSRMLVMDAGRIVQEGTPEQIGKCPSSDFVRELVTG